jgi:hypothetical protein
LLAFKGFVSPFHFQNTVNWPYYSWKKKFFN